MHIEASYVPTHYNISPNEYDIYRKLLQRTKTIHLKPNRETTFATKNLLHLDLSKKIDRSKSNSYELQKHKQLYVLYLIDGLHSKKCTQHPKDKLYKQEE